MAESVDCPDGFELRETLLVRGDFQCGANCLFHGPVYAAGDAVIGKGSRLDAVSAEGSVSVGLNARILRWASASGWIDLRSNSGVQHAISETGIRLAEEATADLLFAPEVASGVSQVSTGQVPRVGEYLEVEPPCHGDVPPLLCVPGFREDKLTPLGAETWVYDGSLRFPMPVLLKGKLVVRGSFSCPPGSLLEGDVKSGASIRVGVGSICRGFLTARGDLTLDEHCVFEASLRAGLTLRLCSGVRGFRQGQPVEAASAQHLVLEPNVIVRGRLSAASGIRCGAAEVQGGLALLLVES